MSSSPSTFSSSDHLPASSEQLCYVHCNICETVLAVSVPCTSLSKTVTVRCGHCSNLLSVNMQGLLLPSPAAAASGGGHGLFSPNSHNLLEQTNAKEKFMMNPSTTTLSSHGFNIPTQSAGFGFDNPPKEPVVNKPPEKRQRIPSAYNRFIKEEIQRIKAVNPDISHREAFSAAAKNWAHFPHIQFGLMHDHLTTKKTAVLQQEGEEVQLLKIGILGATPNVGVSPC